MLATWPGGTRHTVTLAPGATAHATLADHDAVIGSYPPANHAQAFELRIYPPGQRSAQEAYWPLDRADEPGALPVGRGADPAGRRHDQHELTPRRGTFRDACTGACPAYAAGRSGVRLTGMRALGLTRGQLRRMPLTEALFMASAIVLGVGLGLVLGDQRLRRRPSCPAPAARHGRPGGTVGSPCLKAGRWRGAVTSRARRRWTGAAATRR